MPTENNALGYTLRRTRPRERGVATLTVVMVLFFILAMVAAYTSRNLIFEQRTSANQYRSTQAFEAAEAGLQWAQAMLNGGLVDNDCQPDDTGPSFRERYLNIAPDSGTITVPFPGGVSLEPTCVFDGTDWQCKCPLNSALSPATPSGGSGPYPAFRVRFTPVPGTPPPPGLVTIEVNGCTRLDEGCIAFPAAGAQAQPATGDALARVTGLLALKSGLAAPPVAALTVRGDLNLAPRVVNSDPASTGITVHAGRTVPTYPSVPPQLETIPGSPADLSKVDGDTALFALDPALQYQPTMFTATFALKPKDYRQQPAVIDMSSICLTSCSAAQVALRAGTNPGRMLWIPGDLVVDADLGSLTNPLVLVVNGDVTFSGGATVHGLLYVRKAPWTSSGVGTVRGAVIAEDDLEGTDVPTFVYDSSVLSRLRRTHGSFVLVPGSWKDYR